MISTLTPERSNGKAKQIDETPGAANDAEDSRETAADACRAFLKWIPNDLTNLTGRELQEMFEDWLGDDDNRSGQTIDVIFPEANDSEQSAPGDDTEPVELTRELMWECFTAVSMGMVCLLPDLLIETRARGIADDDVRKFIASDEVDRMHDCGKSDSYCCMRSDKGVPYIECTTGSDGCLASSNELFAELFATDVEPLPASETRTPVEQLLTEIARSGFAGRIIDVGSLWLAVQRQGMKFYQFRVAFGEIVATERVCLSDNDDGCFVMLSDYSIHEPGLTDALDYAREPEARLADELQQDNETSEHEQPKKDISQIPSDTDLTFTTTVSGDGVVTSHYRAGSLQANREQQRARVFAKTSGRCAYCGRRAKTVDHVIPKSRGGQSTDANLLPCCTPCGEMKGDRTPGEWAADIAAVSAT